MTKKIPKIMALLAFMAIPQTIDKGHSPILKKIEYTETTEISEKELTNARYHLIEINDKIDFIEGKRDFILMRLNEKDIIDSMKKDYIRRLDETNQDLKNYYSKKDSIYKLIKK